MLVTRRRFVNAMALATGPAILRAQRKPGDKPNLLFLWTDQQRADTMAAYGNPVYRMPALNRLAMDSIVFDRCYVTQPVCTPSRSSVMTGLWPHTSGCVRNNVPLVTGCATLPELLGDSSYRTGYMGKWHLGDEIFAQHGFQEWAAIEEYSAYFSSGRDRNARSAYHKFLVSQGYRPGPNNYFSRQFAASLPVEHTKPSFLAQEASRFILEHRREPWVLYVNTLEPHMPYTSRLNDLHREEEISLPANYPGIPKGPEPSWYRRRREQTRRGSEFKGIDSGSRAGWLRVIRNYAGLCSLVDQAVGRILWALEASGQMENTIVVFTSDHGDMMGSHSMLAKQVMYEEAVRVPWLLRVPFRWQQPMRITQPVSLIDMVPTLLHLMGRRDAGAPCQGSSLVSVLQGRKDQDGHVFMEWTEDESQSGPGPNGRAVISPDGMKLVFYDTDECLLFDRSRDPLEMNNVYGTSGTRALRARLMRWQKSVGDTFPIE